MKIALGADHGGFTLKQKIGGLLVSLGYEIADMGCHSQQSVDYPDIAERVIEQVCTGKSDRGILVCGTGIGMCMAANRKRKIRAALCHDEYTARMSREHNDANILCIGERVTGEGVALDLVKTWLATSYAGGRHQQRIEKFSDF